MPEDCSDERKSTARSSEDLGEDPPRFRSNSHTSLETSPALRPRPLALLLRSKYHADSDGLMAARYLRTTHGYLFLLKLYRPCKHMANCATKAWKIISRLQKKKKDLPIFITMTSWNHLIRFKATDGKIYFASIDAPKKTSELAHLSVTGFPSFEDLQNQTKEQQVTVKEVRIDTMVEFRLVFSSSHTDQVLVESYRCWRQCHTMTWKSSASE